MKMIKREEECIDRRIIDSIRGLGIDMIDNAKSGHPGIVLGAAPIISILYANHMKINPKDHKWPNRDRFVMSCGHGSALLYATLFMAGYNISLDDLKNFRKMSSITPGHPEYGVTPGVDSSTGPLGEGIATAVGMAISEAYLRAYFGKNIFDYYTYVLCGDGCLMEGISYEAMSLAGHLKLNKIILLYDSNDITLDGSVKIANSENMKLRAESMNWNYILVSGNNTTNINDSINKAKQSDRPTIIEIKTTIGKYSKNQATSLVHGSPLDKEDILNIKTKLNLREYPFAVSQEILEIFQTEINTRNKDVIDKWNEEFLALQEPLKTELNSLVSNNSIKIADIHYDFPNDGMDSTRSASGKIINSIASSYPFILGGSADVSKSTMARINNTLDFSSLTPSGRNINFGIRENAMAAMANGMALSYLTPFVSTFFAFSDYMKPSIRMTALMNLPVIYVFTHDSISVGEDGPTHQPVEQLVALRSMPNLDVYRPADANEVVGCYRTILERRKPAAIVLGRNKVSIYDTTKASEIKNGAYIVQKEIGSLNAIIITTGEELSIALSVYDQLTEKGYGIRIVSMPCMEIFEEKSNDYKKEILPTNIETFVIEASSSFSWYKYVSNDKHLFTVNDFGKSASKEDLYQKFSLNFKEIVNEIEELLKLK